MHTTIELVSLNYEVIGLDNLNTYYSVDLKLARLKKQGIDTSNIEYNLKLKGNERIEFIQLDLTDTYLLEKLFVEEQFNYVIHLAAQAGVRYSIDNPHAYIDSNVKGFLNILEGCRKNKVMHLIYASSSSVYGLNEGRPFDEIDKTEKQVSLYAATKKANEAMAHSYACVHGLPVTGLRFFTVYGPYGRPDMAIYKFTKKILANEPIEVYNNGNLSRDFTYIDDIINGVTALLQKKPLIQEVPFAIFNIGRGKPIQLLDFIKAIEEAIGVKADLKMLPMQPGDVEHTWAKISKLEKFAGYHPKMELKEGVKRFVEWYLLYAKVV